MNLIKKWENEKKIVKVCLHSGKPDIPSISRFKKKMSQRRQSRESLFTFRLKIFHQFDDFFTKFKFADFQILRFLKLVWTPCSKIQSTYKHHHHKGGCDVSWRWSPTTDEMVMCTWSNISANVKENKIFKIIIFFRKLNK